MKKYFAGFIICLMLCLSMPMIALADFGGCSGGGGSGGGGSGGGGSGGGGFDYDDSRTSNPDDFGIRVVIMLITYGLALYYHFNPSKESDEDNKLGYRPVDESNLMSVSEYVQKYSCPFDEEDFKRNIARLYIELQHEWTQKDLTQCKPYLCSSYYWEMVDMVQGLVDRCQTNYVEKIKVCHVKIIGMEWEKNVNVEHMYLRLYTDIIDYTVNDCGNILIEGDRNESIQMQYEWHLIREGKAPVELKKTGLKINLDGWKLAKIKGCRMLHSN